MSASVKPRLAGRQPS